MIAGPDAAPDPDGEPAPYDVPRGTCPACGSGDVVHLVIGMPASPEAFDSGLDWVHWVGCVHPGWERECAVCGARWSVQDGRVVPRGARGDR